MTVRPPDDDALLAWRQLLRVGNVFTSVSNVAAGFLIVQHSWQPSGALAALAAASALMYAAGMALNDAFDADLDAEERPERPIPSGRISRNAALTVGWGLLASGAASAGWAAWLVGHPAPLVVAGCLAVTIVLYDGGLKVTWAGPWAMGWCRTLNVLLGVSIVERFAAEWPACLYAIGIGGYTVALTRLAAREVDDDPAAAARVRNRVRQMILGFIVLDACAAAFAAGWLAGGAVLALLIPTLLMARQAPMT